MGVKEGASAGDDGYSGGAVGVSILGRSPLSCLSRHRRFIFLSGRGVRGGMTLMELIIGLAITAVVAGVLAILINSTAAGTNSQNDGRRALVKMQSFKAQVGDVLSNARSILAVGSNYVVYWVGDQAGAVTPANGAVNLSELRLLEVDTTTGNLNLYAVQWPAGFSNASILSADQTYAAGTAWYAACQTAKSGGYFSPTLIATNVTSLAAVLDAASCTQAKMISIVLNFSDTVNSRQAVLSACLANQVAPM